MKTLLVLATVGLVLLIASCVLGNFQTPFVLLFGWIAFLNRALPRMTVDWPGVILGGGTVVLFTLGVHGIAWKWQRRALAAEGAPGRTWKVRWSLAAVAFVFLLFAAGISMVGAVHQVVWLLTSDRLVYPRLSSGRSSTDTLKWIGIGMHTHASVYGGSLPAGGTFTPAGDMGHSWETHLLPWMAYSTREVDLGRPWNDPVNQKYFKCVIPEFINSDLKAPDLIDSEGYGLSHYAANSRVLAGNKTMKVEDFANGGANTVLIGEVNSRFKPWGHPGNWRDPVRGINRSPDGFGGPRSAGGANFTMADGSVRFVSDRVNPEVLRALAVPGGRE